MCTDMMSRYPSDMMADKQTTNRARPALDHAYWFKASQAMVENAASARIEMAKTVQTMIGWLWTVYAAGAVVGVSLSEKSFAPEVLALIAAPVPILLVAYWLAVWAQAPIATRFDPRIPADIRNKYNWSVRIRAKRLTAALVVSLLSVVVVAAALIAASMSRDLDTTLLLHERTTGDQRLLWIQGTFGESKDVTLEISPETTDEPAEPEVITYEIPASGSLDVRLPIEQGATRYTVTALWQTKDGSEHSLRRAIDLNGMVQDQ